MQGLNWQANNSKRLTRGMKVNSTIEQRLLLLLLESLRCQLTRRSGYCFVHKRVKPLLYDIVVGDSNIFEKSNKVSSRYQSNVCVPFIMYILFKENMAVRFQEIESHANSTRNINRYNKTCLKQTCSKAGTWLKRTKNLAPAVFWSNAHEITSVKRTL